MPIKTKEVLADDLALKVAQRQRFVEKVISYAQKAIFTPKLGTIISSHEHSSHTQTAAELNDLEGFSFYSYGVYTMFGGETVKVWYHPGQHKRPEVPVFEAEWWDIKKCELKHFDPSQEWQDALCRLMRRGKTALDREVKRRAEEQRQLRLQALFFIPYYVTDLFGFSPCCSP